MIVTKMKSQGNGKQDRFNSQYAINKLIFNQSRRLPRFRVHFGTGEAQGAQQTQCMSKG